MPTSITRLDYCQFLLGSQVNYTLTYFAEHSQQWSHDTIRRYLTGVELAPRLVWEKVKDQVVMSSQGYLIFDDTVLDKDKSTKIEMVRSQYSGNAHKVLRGIGIVNCVYVNPETDQFWIIDYRIFNPEVDGKSKLHHVKEMLGNAITGKKLPFRGVLMDTWYAVKWLMLLIEEYGKVYYCPLKSNRLINETGVAKDYHAADSLTWSRWEQFYGKAVHLKDFPQGHRVQLFRLPFSSERTDYVVTNDTAPRTFQDAQEASALRWKVEQFHREAKQLTGLQDCQCRKERIQKNHIACAMLTWVLLKKIADRTQQTLYQVKHNLLKNYMIEFLKHPLSQLRFA